MHLNILHMSMYTYVYVYIYIHTCISKKPRHDQPGLYVAKLPCSVQASRRPMAVARGRGSASTLGGCSSHSPLQTDMNAAILEDSRPYKGWTEVVPHYGSYCQVFI